MARREQALTRQSTWFERAAAYIVADRAVSLGSDHGHRHGGALVTRSVGPPEAHVDRQASAEGLLAREERHADELLEHGRLAWLLGLGLGSGLGLGLGF